MKRIMIAYASYGGGHLSAAKNLKEYIEKKYPNYDVFLFDCMKYVNRVIDKVCGSTYSTITTNVPWFWQKIYTNTQEPIFEKILSLSTKVLSYKLGRLLRELKPDVIISTHFFVSHMFSVLKQKNKIQGKIATIITDYGESPYNEWYSNHEYIDYIFVAHSKMKNNLIKKGVPREKLYDTGIPISENFLKTYNKNELLENLGFSKDKKIVLFFGGGELGLGKTKTIKIFENIVSNFPDIQIIAISGKNESLKNKFEKIVNDANRTNNIRVFGFSNQIAELMSISNIVITKPGGLTTTEALVSHLPVIAINPIPGQEEDNAKFLEHNNAGIWLKKPSYINFVLKGLLKNEKKLETMVENTKQIAKPNSTKDICEILFDWDEI